MGSGPYAEGGPLPPVDRARLAEHEQRLADFVRQSRTLGDPRPDRRAATDLPPWPGPITPDSPMADVEARLDHHLAERPKKPPLPDTGAPRAGEEGGEDR